MASSTTNPLMQPSSSSLATALAAAYNIVQPLRPCLDDRPDGLGAEKARGWANLIGDCAKIMHDKVAATSTTQGN